LNGKRSRFLDKTVHCLLPPFHPFAANAYVSSLKALKGSVTGHLGGRPLPPILAL